MTADPAAKERDNDDDAPRTRHGKLRLRSLDQLDGRTAAARSARDLVASLERDLGGDLSTARRQLCVRAAMLAVVCEDAEARWLQGKPIDVSTYGGLTDRLRRTLEALGLARNPRDVTPLPPDATEHVLELLRQEGAR